nr:hypothetical protein [Tanacetum cinerariifolium]
MKLDTDPDSSFVTGGSLYRSYVEVTDGQSHLKVNKPAYQLVNRLTKLEFPAFNGDGFKERSYRCQQFFVIDETLENLKIRLVVIHLRGEALSWHQAYTKKESARCSTRCSARFSFSPVWSPVGMLTPTINLFDPNTVNQAMRLARLHEGAHYALWGLDVPKSQSFHNDSLGYEKNKSSFLPSPSALPSPKFLPSVSQSQSTLAPKKPYTSTNFPKPYIKPSNNAPNQYPTTNNTFTKNTPFKTLLKREYDEKRRNNQCFSCNEKYSPGHVCKNSKLYMVLTPKIKDVREVDAYRYGPLQKNVIEKMVKEMLDNGIIRESQFPIPSVEELLDELHGACLFSKLDLKSGYHQVRMHDSDIPKTAFRTHNGLYEFIIMPFDLSNASATFQNLMNSIFKKHLRNKDGVKADPQKVEAMVQWLIPKNVKGLRGILRLTEYYRRFVKDYGKLAKPLTELLKKGSFSWSTEATLAFEKLKLAMSSTPILALPDFDAPFVIGTDTSKREIGAELIAIVTAIQKWKNYSLFKSFVIKTNHQALKHILEQKECNPTLQKWLSKLIGLQYSVLYQQGKENVVADALPRKDFSDAACWAISSVQTEWKDRIHRSVVVDGKLQGIIAGLKEFLDVSSAYSVQDEVLYKKEKVVVGDDPVLKMDLIKKFHDSALGGHSGFYATHQRLSRFFY